MPATLFTGSRIYPVPSVVLFSNTPKIEPNYKNIEYLKYLRDSGHYIIIYTTRRMEKSKLTFDLLDKFDIPYDEIHFGKPEADFYIDDLAINSYEDLEKHTGIYKTAIKERYFNEIIHEKMDIIIKKSDFNKIEGEIYYYLNILGLQVCQYYLLTRLDL